MQYRLAALGGTFDRLHKGHEQLIRSALTVADKVVIGVTDTPLTQTKTLSAVIEPYGQRFENVREALKRFGADGRGTIIPLTDPYGPTLTEPDIDVLVVSSQTVEGGKAINIKRIERGLSPLPVVEAAMVRDETGEHLSSTYIRRGLSVRSGRSFPKLFVTDIRFPHDLLDRMRQPQGRVVSDEAITTAFLAGFTTIALVGDIVTRHFIERQLPFGLAIVDGQTHRGESIPVPDNAQILTGTNRPGTIDARVAGQIITECMKDPVPERILKVDGEEDLLAFVPALTLPLLSAVFYGQPDKGIVMITLSEAEKIRLARFIDPNFT